MLMKKIGTNLYIYAPVKSELGEAIERACQRGPRKAGHMFEWLQENTFRYTYYTGTYFLPNDSQAYKRIRFLNREDRTAFYLTFCEKPHEPQPYVERDCGKKEKSFPADNTIYTYRGKLRPKYATKKNFAGWYLAWYSDNRTRQADFASRKKKNVIAWCERHRHKR